MACRKINRRKRLPSINPFFHFLKCVWKKFKGCKKSIVLRYAVDKWKSMSPQEKQPFFEAARKAQRLHRQAKKCPKPRCPRSRRRSSKSRPRFPKSKKPKCCPAPPQTPCPPPPPPCPPNPPKKKKC